MQTDVLSAQASATGTLVNARARVKHMAITSAGVSGAAVFRDGGASGAVKITITTPATTSLDEVMIPGEGVLFATDVHLTLTGATSVTIFYG